MMYFIYDFLLLLYAILYLPYLIVTGRAYHGFAVRFGIFPVQIKSRLKQKKNVWLHAVSVGELLALEAFAENFINTYPSYQLVVTTTTKTGITLAQKRLGSKAVVFPSPIDFSFVTARFIALIDPKMYIAVETEIWPNLYHQLGRRKIPAAIINGRISDRSLKRYQWVKFFIKRVLNSIEVFAMQSPLDAQRIRDLGADPKKVTVTGNLKFDALAAKPQAQNVLSGTNTSWLVAGSTHPGEEEIVLNVFGKIRKNRWRLVIAPRHIERAVEVMETVKRHGFQAVKLSQLNGPFPDDAVIVVDTIGQLRYLYSAASLVFVGKSLCGRGGQNMIEPAAFGKAVIIGPHVENFKDIVACFKNADAVYQVKDNEGFETAVLHLSEDSGERQRLGEAALKVIAENQGASGRCLQLLSGLLQ